MKPHLPKMLGAALRAALSSMSFVTVATGTLTAIILAGAAPRAAAASPYIWTGEISDVWDTATENWTQDGAPAAFKSGSGSAVTFSNAATKKSVTVDGTLTAGAMTVDGSYTFGGAGKLTISSLNGSNTDIKVNGGLTITTNKATGSTIVDNGSVFSASGDGSLSLTTIKVSGQAKFSGNDVSITGGGNGQGATNYKLGLCLNANAEVSISGGTTTVGGTVYMGGDSGSSKLTVGTGGNAATLVATRMEVGDTNGSGDTTGITVGRKGKIVITGAVNSTDYRTNSLHFSEWGNTTTVDIMGEFYAKGAQMRSGNQISTVNIYEGATVAVAGFTQISGKSATKYTVEDGARIIVGSGGITQTNGTDAFFKIGNAELGLSAGTVAVSTALTASGGSIIFNTSQYTWAADNASLTQGTTAGTFNVSGAIGGSGGITVTGNGTVNLSAANTYSGNTTVESGTLRVSGSGTLGGGTGLRGTVRVKGGTLKVERDVDISKNKFTVDTAGTVEISSGKKLTLGASDIGKAIKNSGTVIFTANWGVETGKLTVQHSAAGYVDEHGAESTQGFRMGGTDYVQLVEGGTTVDEGARFTYEGKAVTFDAATARAIVSSSEDTDWTTYELHEGHPHLADIISYAESHEGVTFSTVNMYGGDLQVAVDFSRGTVNVYGSGKIGVETNRSVGTVNVYGTGDDGLEFNQTYSPVGSLVMQASGTLKGTVKPVSFTVRSGAEATLRGSVDATNLSVEQGGTVRALGDGNNLFALNGTVNGSVYADERGAVYVGPVGSGSGTVTVNGLVDIASGSELCVRQHGNLIVNGRLHLAGGSTFTPDGTMQVNAAGEVVAGDGIELGTLNVRGRLTAEGDNATVTSAGGSVANLNLAAGQTLVSAGNLTLEANNGVDGNLSVTGTLTAAGNLHLDSVQATAVALTSTASLVADGTLDTESVTLNNRISRDKVYVTAGSLAAGNTDFVVSADAVEALRLGDGMTLTLADLGYTLAGTVSVNGGQSISKAGSDYAYYISQDTATKDIILTARERESGYIWKGDDGDWATGTNWSGGSAPDAEAWVQLRSGSGTISIDTEEEIARMSTYKGTDYTLAGEGSLEIEGALAMQESSLHIGSDTGAFSLTTGSIRLSDGSSLSIADGSDFTTGALTSDGTGARLSGDVTVTGSGGVYRGSYSDARVTLERKAGYRGAISQTLAADTELSVDGTDGTVTLLYGADAHLGGLDVSNMTVVLNSQTEDAVGKSLAIDGTASITNGELVFGLDPESTAATLGTRKAPVVLTAAAGLDLTQSTVVIGQGGSYSKSALVIDTKGRTEDLVLAYVGGEGTAASVDLSGKLFTKYYTNARLVDGAVLVDLRSGYFEQDVVKSTEHNTRTGAAMLDEALKYTNPQVNNPDGELAGIMDALESDHIAHNRVEQIAAGLSGASTAALGMAASQDVDRQLRAIRNRTTTMGVGDGADRTGMPYVNAWINAEADYRQLDADNTLAGYKMTSWGGTLGFDVDCTPRFTCGLAITAMHGDFCAKSAETAEGDLDRTYLTAFAHYTHRAWAHTLVAAFGWFDSELERSINYGTRTATTKGDSDGDAIGLMYEVGYTIALTEDATTCIQPLFNVSWRHSSIGGYSETGSETALTVGDMEANVTTFALGARLQSAYGTKPCNRASLFEARALAKLACGDKDTDGKVNLSGLPTHNVKSAEMGSFGVEIGAGVTIPMLRDNDALFLDLSAEFWSGFANVNGVIGYRVNF